MPGQRTNYQATFLTARALYRAVAAADSQVPDGPDSGAQIEILDLTIDPNSGIRNADNSGIEFTGTWSAHNAVLEIFALLTNITAVTLAVYAWGEPGAAPATVAELKGSWCKLGEFTLTENSLLSLTNIPAAIYRICVKSLTPGDGSPLLRLVTQNTL